MPITRPAGLAPRALAEPEHAVDVVRHIQKVVRAQGSLGGTSFPLLRDRSKRVAVASTHAQARTHTLAASSALPGAAWLAGRLSLAQAASSARSLALSPRPLSALTDHKATRT